MDVPKTNDLVTPRLLVKFLTKIVDEINSIDEVIAPLREQREAELIKEQAAEDAKRKKETIATKKAQELAQAKAKAKNKIAAAKAMIAKDIAEAKAEKDEAKALAAAKALLKKETTNEG